MSKDKVTAKREYRKHPKQLVLLKFEKFQLIGPTGGNFILQELEGEYHWNEKQQDYVWKELKGEIVVSYSHYFCNLGTVLRCIHDKYWESLQIGTEENIVEEFWELLAIADRIDKRMEKVQGKLFKNLSKRLCKKCAEGLLKLNEEEESE